jgi:hypothetical protein
VLPIALLALPSEAEKSSLYFASQNTRNREGNQENVTDFAPAIV